MPEIRAREVWRLPEGTIVTVQEVWQDGGGNLRMAAPKAYVRAGRGLQKRRGRGWMPIMRAGVKYWIREGSRR